MMKARTINQILTEVKSTQALDGVAGRLIEIEDSKQAGGKFTQMAKLTDKDGNGPVLLQISESSLVLDKRLEGLPVYFLSTEEEGSLRGVGACVARNGERKILVRAGANILIHVQNGQKQGALSYEKWLQQINSKHATEATGKKPDNPATPAAKPAAAESPKPASELKVGVTPEVEARLEGERHRRERAKDLQNAFLTARANAQAVLVCHLEAMRWAHMVKEQFGEVMDHTNIAAMRTNFIMRNCTNGTNIVGLMPARRKNRRAEDLGFEVIIREHEEMHGYKLSESEFVNAPRIAGEGSSEYVSTIRTLFEGHLDQVQSYMQDVLHVKFEKGQTWEDVDESILETIIGCADELIAEFTKAA